MLKINWEILLAQILCSKFFLVFFNIPLTRRNGWKNLWSFNYWMIKLNNSPNGICFFNNFMIQELKIRNIAQLFWASVSLVKGKFEGTWENLKHKNQVIISSIFWEGHKILQNLPLTFDYSTYSQKLGEDFAKFCGLLRIYELYWRNWNVNYETK